VLEAWSLVCDQVISLDCTDSIAGDADALAARPLERASAVDDDPLLAASLALRALLATLLHHGIRALSSSWPADSQAMVARLRHIGWPALAEALALLNKMIQEPQAPDGAQQLTRQFSMLVMLRQLHADALAEQDER